MHTRSRRYQQKKEAGVGYIHTYLCTCMPTYTRPSIERRADDTTRGKFFSIMSGFLEILPLGRRCNFLARIPFRIQRLVRDRTSDTGVDVILKTTTSTPTRTIKSDPSNVNIPAVSNPPQHDSSTLQVKNGNTSTSRVAVTITEDIKVLHCGEGRGRHALLTGCGRSSYGATGNVDELPHCTDVDVPDVQDAKAEEARDAAMAVSSRIRVRRIAASTCGDFCELSIHLDVSGRRDSAARNRMSNSEKEKVDCHPSYNLPAQSALNMTLPYSSPSPSERVPSNSLSSIPSSPSSSLPAPSSSSFCSSSPVHSSASASSPSPLSAHCSAVTADEREKVSPTTYFHFCIPGGIEKISIQSSSTSCKNEQNGDTLAVLHLKLILHLKGDFCFSLPDLLDDNEAECLRGLTPLIVECKHCSKTFATLQNPEVLTLPSGLWQDMTEAMVCEECPPLKIARDRFLPRPNQICVGSNFIALHPNNVEEATLRRRTNVVECAACMEVVGTCGTTYVDTPLKEGTQENRCFCSSSGQDASYKEDATVPSSASAAVPLQEDVCSSSWEAAAVDSCNARSSTPCCRSLQTCTENCACSSSFFEEPTGCRGGCRKTGRSNTGNSHDSCESSSRDVSNSIKDRTQGNSFVRGSCNHVSGSCGSADQEIQRESSCDPQGTYSGKPVCSAWKRERPCSEWDCSSLQGSQKDAHGRSSASIRDSSSRAGRDNSSARSSGTHDCVSNNNVTVNNCSCRVCSRDVHGDGSSSSSACGSCRGDRSSKCDSTEAETLLVEEIRVFKQRVRVPRCDKEIPGLENTLYAGDVFWRYTDISCLTAKLQKLYQEKHISKFLFSTEGQFASFALPPSTLSEMTVTTISRELVSAEAPSELSGCFPSDRPYSGMSDRALGVASTEKCCDFNPVFFNEPGVAASCGCEKALPSHQESSSAGISNCVTALDKRGPPDADAASSFGSASAAHATGFVAAKDIKRVSTALQVPEEKVVAALLNIRCIGVTVVIPEICGVMLLGASCSLPGKERAKESAEAFQQQQGRTSLRAMKVLCKAVFAAGDGGRTSDMTCSPDEKFAEKAYHVRMSPRLFYHFLLYLWEHAKCCYDPSFTLSSRCLNAWTPSFLPLAPPADTLS